jgi:BirA family biotin operon repressor/biotin-[acetyl-CoA-carboxylase] ligase
MQNRVHLKTTTSNMDDAARLIKEGAPHLTLVTAGEITAARGRQGKAWTVYPHHSIAPVWILRDTPTQHLALVASLAVIDAIHKAVPDLDPVIKWPNDIYVGGKKLCGILVETHGPNTAALGIGLNVTTPPDLRGFPGITLQQASPSTPPGPKKVLEILNTCIIKRVALYQSQGWSAVAPDYTALCITLHQSVRLQRASDDKVLPATVNALNPDGSLDVVTEDGKSHQVTNADKLFHDYLS